MTMTASPRDLALTNLVRANEIRSGVASLRRRIAALDTTMGREFVASLIENRDLELEVGPIGSMRLGMLLNSIRAFGPTKTRAVTHRAGVFSIDRHVRSLTDRERAAIAAVLRGPRC